MVTTLKNELKENIATLLDLQSEHIQTRKESRCAPFRDNIQKCIMQLVGELDVPTTKVSQVLQSVSKWLYDKDVVAATMVHSLEAALSHSSPLCLPTFSGVPLSAVNDVHLVRP